MAYETTYYRNQSSRSPREAPLYAPGGPGAENIERAYRAVISMRHICPPPFWKCSYDDRYPWRLTADSSANLNTLHAWHREGLYDTLSKLRERGLKDMEP